MCVAMQHHCVIWWCVMSWQVSWHDRMLYVMTCVMPWCYVVIFLTVLYTLSFSFEDEKGFYCIKRSVGRPKCLGAGKGRVRQYGQVDEKSRAYLQQVFYTPNLALKHLLAQVGSPIPSWLAANSWHLTCIYTSMSHIFSITQ